MLLFMDLVSSAWYYRSTRELPPITSDKKFESRKNIENNV